MSSVSCSDSDSSVAYNSDGEPAMVGNAAVGLRDAYKYEPTLTDSEPESDTTGGGTAGAEACPGGPPMPARHGTTDWYEC